MSKQKESLSISMAKVILVVAIIVSLGAALRVVGWIAMNKKAEIQQPQVSPAKKSTPKVEMAKLVSKIINEVVPENYNRQEVKFFIDDLNGDGLNEIIITAIPSNSEPGYFKEAYLVIVTFIDQEKNYKKLADFTFHADEIGYIMRDIPEVANSGDVLDIDGDEKKEIVLDLGTGGASNDAFGIFKIDWDLNKINWLKVQKKDGGIGNTSFSQGGSVMRQEIFQLKDLDNDKAMEIVEKQGKYISVSGKPEDWEKEENWQWQIWVYKWNSSIFIYNKELSNLLTETADWKTYRNEKYGYEVKYPENIKDSEIKILPSAIRFYSNTNKKDLDSLSYIVGITKDDISAAKLSPLDWAKERGVKGGPCFWDEYEETTADGLKVIIVKLVHCAWQAEDGRFREDFRPNLAYIFKDSIVYTLELWLVENPDEYPESWSPGFLDTYEENQIISEEEKELKKIFDQILSTFKFIGIDETADWKTYRNEEYGFEMKYPLIFEFENPVAGTSFRKIILGHLIAKSKDVEETIGIIVKQEKLNPENIIGLYGKIENKDIKNIMVDGRQSYTYREGDAGCGGSVVLIPDDDKTFQVSFIDCQMEAQTTNFNSAESYMEKILSTFKFIEKTESE